MNAILKHTLGAVAGSVLGAGGMAAALEVASTEVIVREAYSAKLDDKQAASILALVPPGGDVQSVCMGHGADGKMWVLDATILKKVKALK